MFTPDALERQFTLLTAAARYDELRTRDALAPAGVTGDGATDDEAFSGVSGVSLSREEVLEMLALGEVIARKAGYGRQLGVRTARATGASWAQIGAALGTSKQSAWEAHSRWIEEQVEQQRRDGLPDEPGGDWAAAARVLAGEPEEREGF